MGYHSWSSDCIEEGFNIQPDRVELIGAGSLGYGTGPSFG